VHCTKISPELEKVKVTGDKKQKSAEFCLGIILWGAVLVQHFIGSGSWEHSSAVVLSATSTPVGKPVHAVKFTLILITYCKMS